MGKINEDELIVMIPSFSSANLVNSKKMALETGAKTEDIEMPSV